MEDLVKKAKNAYFRQRYAKDPSKQQNINNKYWHNKACKELGKEVVTDEEVRQCKNAWYRQYTAKNRAKIKAKQDEFYLRQTKNEEE